MEKKVLFQSGAHALSGILHVPDAMTDAPRAAFLVMHGFGSNKNGGFAKIAAGLLADLGYVVLRFDFRGCGESEGPRGRVLCLEQVDDARAAFDFIATQPGVDPTRIGLMGHSFGAAVAVYAAATDPRIAACISSGGWGDGDGHVPVGTEELDPYRAGVLHDEVDQGHTQHGRDGHGHPYPADPGVVDAVAIRASSMQGVPLLAWCVLCALVSGSGLHVGFGLDVG